MQPRVTLVLPEGSNGPRQLPISSSRFTIGRGADNDLVIDSSGLSRRHTIIEIHDGMVQVSDCGSLNGTFVNSVRITAPTVIKDEDVISIGEIYEICVRIGNYVEAPGHVDHQVLNVAEQRRDTSSWTGRPIIAFTAIAIIFLAAGALVVLLGIRDSTDHSRGSDGAAQSKEIQPRPSSGDAGARAEGGEPRPAGDCGSLSAVPIVSEAVQVMLRSSSDRQRYEFPPEALIRIRESIERYCKVAELAPALRSISKHRAEIAADVARRGQGLEPCFVVYAALAQTDGGRTASDYVAIIRQMIPTLVTLGIDFGSDADSSLIVLAAQTMGPGTKKSHPLLPRIREVIKSNPSAKRSVWYLYEHDAISREAYSFVVRFLALGIIAQNPRQFGIEAEALAF